MSNIIKKKKNAQISNAGLAVQEKTRKVLNKQINKNPTKTESNIILYGHFQYLANIRCTHPKGAL